MGNAASRPPPPPNPRGSDAEPPITSRPGWRGWILLGLLLAAFYAWTHFAGAEDGHPSISYTAFYKAVEEARVESVTIKGQSVIGKLRAPTNIDGRQLRTFRSVLPAQDDPSLVPLLRSKVANVEVSVPFGVVANTAPTAPVRGSARFAAIWTALAMPYLFPAIRSPSTN